MSIAGTLKFLDFLIKEKISQPRPTIKISIPTKNNIDKKVIIKNPPS